MFNAADSVKSFKKEVLGGYVRFLERLDPQLAEHILASQREAFLAGKAFFEAEAGHADKAIERIRRRAEG